MTEQKPNTWNCGRNMNGGEKWGLTYFDLCAIIEVANELKGRS